MPRRTRSISIEPPLGGIVRRGAIQNQAPYTCINALNVLGSDFSATGGGRDRISTRPGLTTTSLSVNTPYNWAYCNFITGGTYYQGIILTHSGGSRILYVDTSGVVQQFGGDIITTDPGSDFATSCAFMGKPYQTSLAGTLIQGDFASAGAGTSITNAPDKCGLVVPHGTRLVLAGDGDNPFAAHFSRVGGDLTTPGDLTTTDAWDTTITTSDGAVSLTGAKGGTLGEAITSLISHTEGCLIIGMTHSMEVLRGNPKTGEFVLLSPHVGPVMQSAWCHDSQGNLYFFSLDGLYRMDAGCGDSPHSIGRERLPADLLAINPRISGTYVSLSYDPRFRCLWIYIDRSGSDNDQIWSYDLQAPNGAFFKHETSNGPLRLGATLKSASTESKSALLAVNASGTIYQYDSASTESFAAEVWYGPLAPGGEAREGIFQALQATFADNSADVTWTLYAGDSAEAAYNNGSGSSRSATGTFTRDGLSTWRNYPLRGAFIYLKLSTSSGNYRWSPENIAGKMAALGIRRAEATT